MGDLVRSITRSLRSLARSPAFTLPALAILTIGITAATAIFTVADGVILRPLDLPDSRRLVVLCEDHARLAGLCIGSPGNVDDLGRGTRQLSDLGIARTWSWLLSDAEGARGVSGGIATAGFLRALGVRPALGRLFADDEHGPANDRVVLLDHGFWTTRYAADPAVVGSTIRLDGEPYEIVGVLPEGFEAPFDMAGVPLWKPVHFDPLDPEVRSWRGFRAVGRLAPGATLASAQDELGGLYRRIGESHEEVDDEWRLRVTSLLDVVVGDTRPVLLAFLGAATLLLVIVCANVANLLLARGLGRQRELAVRATLGAGRARIVGGILGESLLLSGVATLLSVGLAWGATRLLLRLAPPMPRMDEIVMDARVLAFAALLAIVATAAFAVLPALRVTTWDLSRSVRAGAREGESRGARRLQGALVLAELALSLVLLGGALILSRSFARYLSWEPGFERAGLLAVSAFASAGPTGRYPTPERLFEMWRQAEQRVAAVPGVLSVATASAGPLFGGGDGATPYVVDGQAATGALPAVAWYDVGPRYFATLGLPVREGREIEESDGIGAERVAVVNETMARAAWPGESPLGRTVRLPDRDDAFRVVGVVADVRPHTPGEPPRPEIYWSNRQLGRPVTHFLVRAREDPAALSAAVVDALHAVDPELSLGTPRTLVGAEARLLVRPRFQALVLGVFALAALALSTVGVYAVVSYAVGRRVREMGIRIALGAAAGDVVRLVLRASLTVAGAGVLLGLLGAVAAGRVLRSLAHGVSPTDPLSLAGAAAVLLAAATLAALVPARRVLRADPLQAIRSD